MVEEKQQLRPFFRVMNTDLIGEKPIVQALLKVRGLGFSMSNTICTLLHLPKTKQAGLLTDAEARKIEALFVDLKDIPVWMYNRRLDEQDGSNKHLTGSDLKFAVENDIKRLRKNKTYRGVRHSLGQPVRGQRTRSHFRHGRAVGVQKSKLPGSAPAASKPAKSGKDSGGKK